MKATPEAIRIPGGVNDERESLILLDRIRKDCEAWGQYKHPDRNFIARSADVTQSHRYDRPGGDAEGHSEVHLIVTRLLRSGGERQDLGREAAHGYLRCNNAVFS